MSANIDELSIDSTTNRKVLPRMLSSTTNGCKDKDHMRMGAERVEGLPVGNTRKLYASTIMHSHTISTIQSDQTVNSCAPQRAHFRIDWRQLTYYHKEPRPGLTELFCKQRAQKHRQQSIYDLIDQHEEEYGEEEEEEEEVGELGDNDGGGGEEEERTTTSGGSRAAHATKRRRPILNSLDGCFRSGELAAILGPSGAGKSTFLSALFGNKQESSYGQTKVTWFPPAEQQSAPVLGNAVDGHHHHQQHHHHNHNNKRAIRIAFLPQHDHLLNHLTVYETLMFASKIKNPHQASDKLFHRQNVKRVAKMLKLTECFNTRCGRLSGGQYKRVSIGQELLSEPDVIILDEPTSGLDAMTCLTTIRTLKSIVLKHPISIILTIHQPDIDVFNLFDQVYVIAQGGMAIYEGPPQEVVPTLARANLFMPCENYNPARFIVENAFVADLEAAAGAGGAGGPNNVTTAAAAAAAAGGGGVGANHSNGGVAGETKRSFQMDCATSISEEEEGRSSSSSDDNDDDEVDHNKGSGETTTNFLRRSISSLTDALSGKLTPDLKPDHLLGGGGGGNAHKFRDSGRRPLLNIGIQTADGKLITSDQVLASARQTKAANLENQLRKQQIERLQLLRRLNRMQKEKYYSNNDNIGATTILMTSGSCVSSDILSHRTSSSVKTQDRDGQQRATSSASSKHLAGSCSDTCSSASADSSSWSEARETVEEFETIEGNDGRAIEGGEGSSIASSPPSSSSQSLRDEKQQQQPESVVEGAVHFIVDLSLNANNKSANNHRQKRASAECASSSSSSSSSSSTATTMRQTNTDESSSSMQLEQMLSSERMLGGGRGGRHHKLSRQFDKRLSAKHIQSKQSDYPIWYHSFLLTHRTWLSIVRDPIFFGIQFTMHTTIPILLALIFGSAQEEGCPQVGNFDLVQFAYSDQANFIATTMRSIRQSIGNIGIIFFEMFVLSFAINCITALVFPLDMYVLLKEYRNGWYSLRSYFFGRTLADLPVPIVLHSMAMAILYYLTGQPLSWWRFSAIIGIVILASLVAQSVGLTIGALLMRSSQSAVLAAAGIVAPFFALSGFIVRIQTLPWVAKWAAQGSYLYHLLNGFIIMRYGYGRCECNDEDFEPDSTHPIPNNIRHMASTWIGTYSNEFEHSSQMRELAAANPNRTNLDPNIDIIDKLMAAFKMANSFGHKVESCDDVLPYAMLDFNLKDTDIWHCCISLVLMLLISRTITFCAIYYKIRSFS